jgi:hypothetical protein
MYCARSLVTGVAAAAAAAATTATAEQLTVTSGQMNSQSILRSVVAAAAMAVTLDARMLARTLLQHTHTQIPLVAAAGQPHPQAQSWQHQRCWLCQHRRHQRCAVRLLRSSRCVCVCVSNDGCKRQKHVIYLMLDTEVTFII